MRFGLLPHVGLVDPAQILAFAGEGELAGEMPVGVLINHAAHVVGIVAGEHAVHHHLRDRHLPAQRLAARLEIDRVGETLFRLGARLASKTEALRRAFQPAGVVLAGDRLAAGAIWRRGRRAPKA